MKRHEAYLIEVGNSEKCKNCGIGYCPEATFCDQIVFTFNRVSKLAKQEDRYTLLERYGKLEIYHNGDHVYKYITDQDASNYFKRFVKWYTPHTYA